MTATRIALAMALLVGAALVANAQSVDKDAADADEKWLVETWAKHEPEFKKGQAVRWPTVHLGNKVYKEIRDESFAKLKELEAFEAELPKTREALAAIDARYGVKGDSNKTAAAIAKAQGKKPKDVNKQVWSAHDGLSRRMVVHIANRKKASDSLVKDVDDFLKNETWLRYGEALANLELAQRFTPSEALAARIKAWPDEVAAHKKANGPKLDAEAFPGHIKNFNGPGEPDELGKTSVAFLTTPKDFAGTVKFYDRPDGWTFHKAAVRSQWFAEQTVLGTVTQWQISIHVALSDAEMQADGVAVVIPFNMSCAEHAKQATGWVKGDWREAKPRVHVRLSAVK